MAAYAALVSIMNTMEQIMDHPRIQTSFNNKQMESLRGNADYLLDFIETYPSHGASKAALDLESQIASAAYAAEDAIESHVVDQIHAGLDSTLLLNLQNFIEEMDSLKEKVKTAKEERGILRNPKSTAPSSSKPLASAKTAMVGFDEELIQLMDELTGHDSSRRIISVVGMGGSGKTTLVRNAVENPLITEHFDILGWVTISQSYSVRGILLELLACQKIKERLRASDKEIDQEPLDQLGLKLSQALSGKRYLIVLDDIWNVEAWDKLKSFFPDYGKGSRIVATTRLSNVATLFSSSIFKMDFLDEDRSWDLFCRTAFPQENCPLELEQIGKKIVQKCKGLPLSIVVIGSFLGRSARTKEFWENVARDINSILRSDEDEFCLNLLSLSYSHLPVHLKPCFLYMGILQEDEKIHISQLIKLFVAEGFLKPNKMQSLEEIAKDYIRDLVDRNLILASKRREWDRTAKFYFIHDLLREVCLREAEKEKFLHVMSVLEVPRGLGMEERRIVFHKSSSEHPRFYDGLPSSPLVRSVILKGDPSTPLPLKFPLLKVLSMVGSDPLEAAFEQVNMRCLLSEASRTSSALLPSSVSLLWNVQTLIIKGDRTSSALLPSSVSLLWNVQTLIIKGDRTKQIVAPPEIWNMRQLRHLEFDKFCLPDPLTTGQQEDCVLQNLQTLSNVVNFNFSEDACKRFPNIKKLYISYDDFSDNCLNIDLSSLHKLQSVKCILDKEAERRDLVLGLVFPRSLQKLNLIRCHLHWDKVTAIGTMLPRLEALKLDSVIGPEWNLVEGAFPRLKLLRISNSDLIRWNADNSHFPILEQIVLYGLTRLNEIPLDFGEISTLQSVRLEDCSGPAAISSVRILEEQLNLGNEDIKVDVVFSDWIEIDMFEEVNAQKFPRKNFQCRVSLVKSFLALTSALRFLRENRNGAQGEL